MLTDKPNPKSPCLIPPAARGDVPAGNITVLFIAAVDVIMSLLLASKSVSEF